MAAKKKQLNEAALLVTSALSVALSFEKDADVVTHNGKIIANTPIGIVYIPFDTDLQFAVKAKGLHDALKGATEAFTISETHSQLFIGHGKKRAELKVMPKVSVNFSAPDPVSTIEVPENLSELLHDVVKDLSDNNSSPFREFLFLTSNLAFWTNTNIAAMIETGLNVPDAIVYIKDVKAAMSYGSRVVNIGGSASSITFHYADGVAIKIPTVDDSHVKYPKQGIFDLFQPNLYSTAYPLTEEHIDALTYVSKFANEHLFIQPTHIGTTRDPNDGTSVMIDDLPLDLAVRADLVKLGGFKKATTLVKAASATKAIAFYTCRDKVTFCFVRLKV